jgi:hypothetical protein
MLGREGFYGKLAQARIVGACPAATGWTWLRDRFSYKTKVSGSAADSSGSTFPKAPHMDSHVNTVLLTFAGKK